MLDEVTFDEIIGLEIQGWIMNLEGTRMNAALSELELLASGTPFAKSDRLYRRLRGDYTQADFARTSDEHEETEAIVRRDKKLSEFINNQKFSERTINEVIARKNATRRLLRSQVRFSSTPNSMTETHLQHQHISLTDDVNASEWSTTSEQPQGAGQGLQTLASYVEARDAPASGGYSPPITTISSGWHRTATTVTSTTTVANTQSTNAAQSGPRSVFSTGAYHRSDDLVKCTFTDRYTFEVSRVAAMQMVQMQALTEEYRKEISELQIQMSQLISSTRTHLNMQNSTAPHKQKTANFRDTFSMQYLLETNSTVHEQSAALNTNKQREAARNTNAQREAALKANAQREATLNATKQRD